MGGTRSACSVDIYEHPDRGGKHANVTSSIYRLDDDRPGGIRNNGVSSFQVNGCNDTVVAACRHDAYTSQGEDCMYLRGYNYNLDRRRKFNDDNWDNEWDSIVFTNVPGEDADWYAYDRVSHRYTPASPNDGYCGGCRLWPQVKDRGNHANANRDDVWVAQDPPVGHGGIRPCPGGEGYFTSGTGVKCRYKKNDGGASLQSLYASKGSDAGTGQMWVDLANKFCSNPDNIAGNPGDKTCLERDTNSNIAKTYCSVGARIKTDGACTKNNLGNHYTGVVDAYCSTAAGKSDMWCSCLHAKKGRCDLANASEFAGCDDVNRSHNELIEDIPEDSLSGGVRQQLKERKHCRAKICDNPDAYIPDNAMDNCALNLQVCVQDVQVRGHLIDSGINVTCNQEQNINQGGGGGGSDVNEGERNDYTNDPNDKKKKKTKKKSSDVFDNKYALPGGIASFVLCVSCSAALVAVM